MHSDIMYPPKTSNIMPVQKQQQQNNPPNYHLIKPEALTPEVHRKTDPGSPPVYQWMRPSTTLHTIVWSNTGRTHTALCVDYSSEFISILPSRLFSTTSELGMQHNICLWVQDFLMWVGLHHSSSLTVLECHSECHRAFC